MRYAYLAALIALIALGAKALDAVSGGAFAQDSEILLYLLAGFLIVCFALLHRPESVERFVRQYSGAIGISALGFLLMFGLGLAMLFGLAALLMSTGHAALASDVASATLSPLLLGAVLSMSAALAAAIPEELFVPGFHLELFALEHFGDRHDRRRFEFGVALCVGTQSVGSICLAHG
jgi:hypothetical protein